MIKTHPLEYVWTFYYEPRVIYKRQTEQTWLSNYKKVCNVDSVESFWRLYNNMINYIDIPYGSIYAMFRNNIHPSWEHPENRKGFSWIIYINKFTSKKWIKQMYEESMLLLIGCMYEYESMLNGCTFEKKGKGGKIVYWFKKYDKNTYNSMLLSLFNHLCININEYRLCNENTKIDWRLPDFKRVKIAVKIAYHNL